MRIENLNRKSVSPPTKRSKLQQSNQQSQQKIHPMFLQKPKKNNSNKTNDDISYKNGIIKHDDVNDNNNDLDIDKVNTNANKLKTNNNKSITFLDLTNTFNKIESTTKRLEITELLTQFFVSVIETKPDELLMTVYLTINRLCPDYEGLELGIGESILIKAVTESTGRTAQKVKEDLKKIGDLGTVSQNARKNQPTMFKPKPLDVPTVFKNLKEIATASGNQSQAKKIGIIRKMLTSCEPNSNEVKFLMRLLEGKLRIGLAERTVVVALSNAIVLSKIDVKKYDKTELNDKLNEAVEIVKQVYSELPSYDLIVPALLEGGIDNLNERCHLTPGNFFTIYNITFLLNF